MMGPAAVVKRDDLWLCYVLILSVMVIAVLANALHSLWLTIALQRIGADTSSDYELLVMPIMGETILALLIWLIFVLLYPKEQARQRCARGEGDFRTVDLAPDAGADVPMTLSYRLARTYSLWPWGIVAVILGPMLIYWLLLDRSLALLFDFFLPVISMYVLMMTLAYLWQWRRLDVTSDSLTLRHWFHTKHISWDDAKLFAIIWRSRGGISGFFELSNAKTIIRWPSPDYDIITCNISVAEMQRVLAYIAERTTLPLYSLE